MVLGMLVMAVRQVRMMRCTMVVTFLVVLVRFAVMMCCLLMVVSCFLMMIVFHDVLF
jgi:hypothetical protein